MSYEHQYEGSNLEGVSVTDVGAHTLVCDFLKKTLGVKPLVGTRPCSHAILACGLTESPKLPEIYIALTSSKFSSSSPKQS